MFWLMMACNSEPKESVTDPAVVMFLVPGEGESLQVGTQGFAIIVENFELVSPAKHSEGLAAGYVEVTLDDTVVGQFSATNFDVDVAAAGNHTVTATLFYEDGDEVDPPATDTVSFLAIEG